MANASARSPGPVNSFKWIIARLRTAGVPGPTPGARELKQASPTTCLIVLLGSASAASVVEALNLADHNNLDGSPETIEGELSIDLSAPSSPWDRSGAVSRSLASIENDHIQRVLAECGGNKSEAARRLRITRRTLQRRLKA
jgi:two-component system response regulator RegA